MKKILSLLAALALLMSTVPALAESAPMLTVVTTIYPQYDFVRAVAGDTGAVALSMLLKPGAEMHAYEPTPQDIIAIRNADLFIYVGGESDVWVEEILSSMPESNVKTIKLMDMVPTLNEELVEGMQADHDHDHEEGEEAHEDEDHDHEEGEEAHEDEDHDHEEGEEAHEDEDHDHEEGEEAHEDEDHDHEEGEEEVELDEHVWTAPLNAAAMVTGIAAELAALAPAHAEAFTANAAAYVQQLTELDAAFREVVKTAKRTELIFGDRFAMRYFTHAYGLTYYAAFPGCSGETEPSAQTVAFLMNKVKEDKVPVVLYPELSTHRVADVISEETGVPSRLFYACHNLTADEFAEGKTYVDFMTANLAVLKEALN